MSIVALALYAVLGLGIDGRPGAPQHAQLTADRSAIRTPLRSATGTTSVCPNESDDCQLPDQQGHGSGGTLAASVAGFIVADDFYPTSSGIINEICWWGAYFNVGPGPDDCGPGAVPDNWQITYYESAFSGPGRIIAGPFVIGEAEAKAPTGEQITNGTTTLGVYGFTATHPDVAVNNSSCYWIEITNLADGGQCNAMWSTAPLGNGLSYQSDSDEYDNGDVQDYDLAWCVNGPTVEAASCTIDDGVDCSPGAVLENEPACADDYVDVTNGGCDAAPGNAAWLPTAFGNNYCGEMGGFRFTAASCTDDSDCPGSTCVDDTCTGPVDARDSDWWDITVTEQTYVYAEIVTNHQAFVGFTDDQDHACTDPQFLDQDDASGFVGPLQQRSFTACLEPGSWSLFVAPASFGLGAGACGPFSTYDFFLGLADAGEGPGLCPTIQTVCTIEDGLLCQYPDQMGHGPESTVGATSDNSAELEVADSILSIAGGPITTLCWWGFYADETSTDCGPGEIADDFTIRYYENAGGQPGTSIAEFNQSAGDLLSFDKTATQLSVTGFSEYGFTATHPPVMTSPGECLWVSVQGRGGNDPAQCYFQWSTAPPGDGRSWQAGADAPQAEFDLAFCVNTFIGPDGCNVTGACCDVGVHTCQDDVTQIDCPTDFAAETTCAHLGPPCTCAVAAGHCGDADDDGVRDDPCAFYACEDSVCTTIARNSPADMAGQFGACIIDGAADGNDRFMALSCFSNQWSDAPCELDPPNAINVDAGRAFGACALDGICDGNDAFAALNSFAGSNTCDAQCAPAPFAPTTAPTIDTVRTGLRLDASALRVAPGGTVAVDVLLTAPLKDLRGYQLHLGVDGGAAGMLELIDIAIEPRRDAAFATRPEAWQAFNTTTAQMLAGLDTDGIAVSGGAYLATFTYRVSPDARGQFVIDVRADHTDADHRTFLFPTPANGRIEIVECVSAMIHVLRRPR